MIRTSFNHNWSVIKEGSDGSDVVGPLTLPYDAMHTEQRDAQAAGGPNVGFFPGGVYRYRKTFTAPPEWRGQTVVVEFEGVYHRSKVYLNGRLVGGRPSGYAVFEVPLDDLDYGADNVIEVVAHNDDQPNSRWYSGSGIYRPVSLLIGGPIRITPTGLQISTLDVRGRTAEIEIATELTNSDTEVRTVTVAVAIGSETEDVAASEVTADLAPGATTVVRQALTIHNAALWSPDSPVMHTARATVHDRDLVLDTATEVTGLRVVTVDPRNGLRINGTTYKLRGACIHHDNGVIGAHEFDAAARRRVRILKESGYNAIRSAHNPISRAMLRACDAYGVMVMDELTDAWYITKATFDYGLDFEEWWERDLAAMIAKDFNHPSVITYSIGNEIAETSQPKGIALNRAITARAHELDPSRPVTNSINVFLNLIASSDQKRAGKQHKARESGENASKNLIAVLNYTMSALDKVMPRLVKLPAADKRTRESFAAVDIAGYNYADGRYRTDGQLHPHRVIVGSETSPTGLASRWKLVEELPHVIGDFVWTAWDYIGEAGLATKRYNDRRLLFGPYPALLADEPIIDITGFAQTQTYLNRIIWGQSAGPHLAVEPVNHSGEKQTSTSWRSTNSVDSWSWEGCEGRPARVEVYANADRVELILNGTVVGTHTLSPKDGYLATFDIPYQPGELLAVAYHADGSEIGRDYLRSAENDLQITLTPEASTLDADGDDLLYLPITLTDHNGVVRPLADRAVTVNVTGAGALLGLGSAEAMTTEGFAAPTHRTFYGRALAVVRAGHNPGEVTIAVTADGCAPVSLTLPVIVPESAGG